MLNNLLTKEDLILQASEILKCAPDRIKCVFRQISYDYDFPNERPNIDHTVTTNLRFYLKIIYKHSDENTLDLTLFQDYESYKAVFRIMVQWDDSLNIRDYVYKSAEPLVFSNVLRLSNTYPIDYPVTISFFEFTII